MRDDPSVIAEWERKGLITASAPKLAETVTEKQFMQAVTAEAKRLGWKVFHVHDSRRSESGWPDLAMVRERLVLAELKTATGQLSAAQQTWIEALQRADVEVHIWKPNDFERILEILK